MMDNYPPGVTGQEPEIIGTGETDYCEKCGADICDHWRGLGASLCCECDGRLNPDDCEDCFQEQEPKNG